MDFLLSAVHGSATYVKETIFNFQKVFAQIVQVIYVVVIKVSGISSNFYFKFATSRINRIAGIEQI